MLKRHASTPLALVAGFAFLLPWILDLSGPAVPCAYAQDSLYIYPKNGQSDEQQKKDRYECHMWAVQQTGFDPTAPTPTQAPAGSSAGGQVVRGAGRGAALGAVGGAIAGDAGKGAAIGAAVGGAGGAMRRAGQKRQQEEQQQQAAAASQQSRADYNRALSTCMEARGYQVN